MRNLKGWAVALVMAAALTARADDKDAENKLDTPEKCVEAFKAALGKADAKAFFRSFSPATRKKFFASGEEELKKLKENAEDKAEAAKELGVKPEDLDTMTPEEYVTRQFESGMKASKTDVEKMKFNFTKKEDARAVAEMDDGKEKRKIVLLKTDGEWGIDEEATQKLEEDDSKEGDKEEEGSGSK